MEEMEGGLQRQRSADAQERATSGAGGAGADVIRDMAGETVCGFRVAAWRETHPEHGDKYGHTYSEHWSTPSQHPAVRVERLFTEDQLRAAIAGRLRHDDLCRLSIMFGRASDLRTDQDIRINEWLKAQITDTPPHPRTADAPRADQQ